jgi:anti-sigma regulatory factor (Ser/Thr protein kinase)
MSTFKLEMLNSAFRGKQVRFKDGLMVGSAPECQLRASHPDIKPRHLRFFLNAGRPMCEIVDETAIIVINGQEAVKAGLKHNDVVQAGPIRLKVVDEALQSRASLKLDDLLASVEDSGDEDLYDFAKEDLFYLTTKDPTLRKRISFVIPSKDKFVDQAQVFLARLVKQGGADEEQVDAFMTCAKELILNAHRHGHKYDETKRITVRFRDDGAKLILVIEDEGPGFDHRAVIAKSTAKDAATTARDRYLAGGFGGLGFQLITKLSESLVYNDAGNLVTVVVSKTTA